MQIKLGHSGFLPTLSSFIKGPGFRIRFPNVLTEFIAVSLINLVANCKIPLKLRGRAYASLTKTIFYLYNVYAQSCSDNYDKPYRIEYNSRCKRLADLWRAYFGGFTVLVLQTCIKCTPSRLDKLSSHKDLALSRTEEACRLRQAGITNRRRSDVV